MTTPEITLYGSDGVEWPLDGTRGLWISEAGPVGIFGLPPVSFSESEASVLNSGEPRGRARFGARVFSIPLLVSADTKPEALSVLRGIALSLSPLVGDCRLVIFDENGAGYDLTFAYTSGFQPSLRFLRDGVWESSITGRAHDPYFRSLESETISISFPVTGSGTSSTLLDDPNVLLDDPNVPLDGYISSASENTISATINNPGSADAWPVWTVSGATTGVLFTNASTGKQFGITLVTVGLETLTIDMTERQRLIEVDGANAWRYKDPGAEWWSLRPGPNYIIVQVLGADTGTTAAMSYRPRFLSP